MWLTALTWPLWPSARIGKELSLVVREATEGGVWGEAGRGGGE